MNSLPSEHLEVLSQISLRLNASLDLEEVLDLAVREAASAVNAERGLIMIFDAGRRPVPRAFFHLEPRVVNAPDFDMANRIIETARAGHAILADLQNGEISEGRDSAVTGSALCAPLRLESTTLGMLYVDTPKPESPFDKRDLAILRGIATTVASAIRNAQRYQDAARGAVELRRLYETTLDITRQLEIDKLLDLIIHRAADLLHAESGNFYFYDDKRNELVPSAPYGAHVAERLNSFKPGEGASGRVFLSGEPLVIQDYDFWEGRSPRIPRGRYGRVLHVPVKRGNEVVGVMSVNRPLSAPPFSEEDTRLLLLFASQAAIAIENARLYRVAIEKARLERELQVAREVQSSLVPRHAPVLDGWDFAIYWQPAREVSGDFYDFFRLPDGRLGIVIGDVTGKGMPAALMMATTRALLRGATLRVDSPAKVLASVNDLLQPDIPPNTFVTAFYAMLDVSTGRLAFANAGHDLPYQRTDHGVLQLRATGLPLGLMPGVTYECKETIINPGDLILFYSDGLVEAHNPQREMFGFPRLASLAGQALLGMDLIDTAVAELRAFTGPDWDQEDDITIVALDRCPASRR
ncbi:MAG: SpoIIE family protein phosphatase [Acidobacteriota bacterium]